MMNALKSLEEVYSNTSVSSDNSRPLEFSPGANKENEHTLSIFSRPDIFWCIGFSVMLSVAVIGNTLVIQIVLAHRRMRTVTNYFLLNLAVSDLKMALFNAAPNFAYMIQKDWIFGGALCMVNNFIANFSVASSVFTMTAISVDRYLAIVRPLQPRMTKGMARRAIGAIWLCSLILALPGLIYSKIMTYPNPGQGKLTTSACIILWPDGKLPSESNLDFGYNICLLLVTYVIPMIAMAMCYGSMSRELWGHKQIGEAPQRQINSVLSKRKIVRMFIVIVTSFAVCWLPYHAYFIYQYYDSEIVYVPWIRHLYFAFYWLAMSTTIWNPLVLYSMNARFRNYIREVGLRCFCFCRQNRDLNRCPPFVEPSLPPLMSNNSVSKSDQGQAGSSRRPYPAVRMEYKRQNYHPSRERNQGGLKQCNTYC